MGILRGKQLRQMMFGSGLKSGVGYGLVPRTGAVQMGEGFLYSSLSGEWLFFRRKQGSIGLPATGFILMMIRKWSSLRVDPSVTRKYLTDANVSLCSAINSGYAKIGVELPGSCKERNLLN